MPPTITLDLTPEAAAALRDYLAQRHWSWIERDGADGGGFYECRYCRGTGDWGTTIRHRERHTDGGPVMCAVARIAPVLPALIAAIQAAEPRGGASPVAASEEG